MIITCISASNTKLLGDNSASTKVCYKIKELVSDFSKDDITVNIIPLMKYDIKSCILCGECSMDSICKYDDDFNTIYKQLVESDGFFFVVPHYSPIPSKLLITIEKINEITYANWVKNPEFKTPFNNKPAAIIGHGGMAENQRVLTYYHDKLVTPIANTLRSLSFSITSQDDKFINGTAFGLKDEGCIRKNEASIFPDIEHDWEMIEERIKPLVNNLVACMLTSNNN